MRRKQGIREVYGEQMRIFYAIELDEKTKALLSKEQDRLKTQALKANMTRTENLHLTLRFIGEVNPSYIPVFPFGFKLMYMAAVRQQKTTKVNGGFNRNNLAFKTICIKPRNSAAVINMSMG
jgi:hypothetical protein